MTDAILVIGGGVAGINCAMNVAKYGAQVYLVDDTASIGGMMARLDKTFPTNDCSICIEAPQMYEVDNHERIKILTQTEVRRVQKADGIFKVRLVKKAKFIDEEKCTGCGACVEACPVSLPDELDGKVGGKRKLISMAWSLWTHAAAAARCGRPVHVSAAAPSTAASAGNAPSLTASRPARRRARRRSCSGRPTRTSTSISKASWSPLELKTRRPLAISWAMIDLRM